MKENFSLKLNNTFVLISNATKEDFNLIRKAVKHCEKRGYWDEKGVCSECKKNVYEGLDADIWSRYAPPFCPHCGVKMKGVKIDSEGKVRKDLLSS